MPTTTVIYADALFMVNFSMDFLSLYITARLMHTTVRPLRLALSAAIGAIFALISVALEQNMRSIPVKLAFILGFAICAIVMTKIAFNGTLRSAAAFGAVNIGLGGIMTAIYSMLGRVADSLQLETVDAAPDSSPILFVLIAAVSGGVSLLYGRFKECGGRQAEVVIRAFDGEVKLRLLVDSGNLLRDPISGRAVIIVSAEKLAPILPKTFLSAAEDPTAIDWGGMQNAARIRLIPMTGVTGKGMLLGFAPESVTSEGREIEVVIAIDPSADRYGDCEGIIPEMILQ